MHPENLWKEIKRQGNIHKHIHNRHANYYSNTSPREKYNKSKPLLLYLSREGHITSNRCSGSWIWGISVNTQPGSVVLAVQYLGPVIQCGLCPAVLDSVTVKLFGASHMHGMRSSSMSSFPGHQTNFSKEHIDADSST